jgi:signal transduction histidine kinase
MNTWLNLDLLSVGVVVAATCVLGFAVYFSDRKSITNRLFLIYCLITSIWGIVNYFTYQFKNEILVLWSIRIVFFSAVIQALALFEFSLALPNIEYRFSKKHKFVLLPVVLFVAVLTLSSFIILSIDQSTGIEIVPNIEKGHLWLSFVSIAGGLVILSIIILFHKIHILKNKEKKAVRLILIGMILSYFLILFFNLVSSLFFNNTQFAQFSSIFIFPFIAFTAYAILKHKLLNIKSTKIVVLVFALIATTLLGVIYSRDTSEVTLRGLIFLLTIIASIFLLKNVVDEAEQKNKIQNLAVELESANKKLQELDELKSEFISLATHNISTPLTAVNGYISLLQEEHSQEMSKQSKDLLDTARRSTTNLVNIIRDFLDISRLERGKILYHYSDFDLKFLLDQIVKKYQTSIESRGLKLIYSIDENSDYKLHGDKDKIEQAVSNIIDNCIRYTPQGEILIHLKIEDNKICLTILDTSIRKVPVMSEKLAKKFTETGDTQEANIIGHGLGLYVAKQYIENNGGRFSIKQIEKGTKFILEFSVS